MPKIELIFGSLLALVLVGAVAYAGLSGRFSPGGGGGGGHVQQPVAAEQNMTLCGCYNTAFDMAARYDVQSAEYSTQFVLCRKVLGEECGRYFTAGWNARNSSKPWEASCEAFKRSGA